MLSANLQSILDDRGIADDVFVQMGLRHFDQAHQSLLSIAASGVPLDLLEDIVTQLVDQLPKTADADLALRNLERFIVSSRSPMSFAALIVRDPTALSSLLEIFSFSVTLSELLIREPESFDLIRLTDGQPIAKETLLQELRCELDMSSGKRSVKNLLRNFKHREVLRIAYGDLVRKFDVERTTQQLAILADVLCTVGFEYCVRSVAQKQQKSRAGSSQSESLDWESLPMALVSGEAWGTHSFDYGENIQLTVLVRTPHSAPQRELELASKVVAELEEILSELNELGRCYQIDFETRPSGGASKALSLGEAIKYFDQNASAHDRLSFTRLRFLCGQQDICDQYLSSLRALTFRSYFGSNDMAELRALKRGISIKSPAEAEFRNVRKSPGGLHDLEFTVGYLQLLVGKKIPAIQSGNFMSVLFELEKNGVVTQQEYSLLKDHYALLKMLSLRLQVLGNSSSDLIPSQEAAWSRLQHHVIEYLGLGDDFQLDAHLARIAEQNQNVLTHLLQGPDETTGIFEDLVLGAEVSREQVAAELTKLGFQRPVEAYKAILNMAREKHRFISSKRCRYFLSSIIDSLIEKIAKSTDPDETLNSLDLVSDSLGGKGTLWELCQMNDSCLDLCINLCSKAPYLTSLLRSNPGMLDELMDSLIHSRSETVDEFTRELDASCRASQDILPVVLAFKNSKHLQIGVSQLVKDRPVVEVHRALAAVAECCIWKVTRNEYAKLVEKHGAPGITENEEPVPFALVLGGRFGAAEPNYHSTASIWICFQQDGVTLATAGQRKISNQQFFGLLATRVGKLLSQNSVYGRLYELEKLPPMFGDATTTAVSIASFENLFSKRNDPVTAMYLNQCRPKSELPELERSVQELLHRSIDNCAMNQDSWQQTWEQRLGLESNASPHNIKRGLGGTLDIELMARFLLIAKHSQSDLCSQRDEQLHTVDALKSLMATQVISSQEGERLIKNFEWLKSIELGLRLLNLPRRHALPVDHHSEDTEDGQIDHLDQGNLESTNSQDLRIHQNRLVALLGYDRFDALCSDVENLQQENRETVLKIMEHSFPV